MSLRHEGFWHYEYIPARGAGHEYRVGDQDDDVVRDFGSEVEAAEFVRSHNERIDYARRPADKSCRW